MNSGDCICPDNYNIAVSADFSFKDCAKCEKDKFKIGWNSADCQPRCSRSDLYYDSITDDCASCPIGYTCIGGSKSLLPISPPPKQWYEYLMQAKTYVTAVPTFIGFIAVMYSLMKLHVFNKHKLIKGGCTICNIVKVISKPAVFERKLIKKKLDETAVNSNKTDDALHDPLSPSASDNNVVSTISTGTGHAESDDEKRWFFCCCNKKTKKRYFSQYFFITMTTALFTIGLDIRSNMHYYHINDLYRLYLLIVYIYHNIVYYLYPYI